MTGAQIFGLLQQATAEGVTIVMATHDPLIVDYAHRVVEMADGSLVDSGEVKGALRQR